MTQRLSIPPIDQETDHAWLPFLDAVDALDAEDLIALVTQAALHARAMARLRKQFGL